MEKNFQIDKEALGIKNYVGGNSEVKNPFGGESVSFKISNTGTAASSKLLAVTKGWYTSADDISDYAGKSVDDIIEDGTFDNTADAHVIGSGKNCKIADVVNSFSTSPMRIKGIKLAVDDADQLDEEIQILELTPQGKEVIARIIPSDYKSEDNSDAKRVSIPLIDKNIVLGPDRLFLINIGAYECTYTLFFENQMSYAAQLEHLVKKGLV